MRNYFAIGLGISQVTTSKKHIGRMKTNRQVHLCIHSVIQSSAAITLSNIVRYYINQMLDPQKTHLMYVSITHLKGRAMGCLLWIFFYHIIKELHCNNYTILLIHDDVMTWIHFPDYWTWFRGNHQSYIHGLMQERCNSSALAIELSISCTNPSTCKISSQRASNADLWCFLYY